MIPLLDALVFIQLAQIIIVIYFQNISFIQYIFLYCSLSNSMDDFAGLFQPKSCLYSIYSMCKHWGFFRRVLTNLHVVTGALVTELAATNPIVWSSIMVVWLRQSLVPIDTMRWKSNQFVALVFVQKPLSALIILFEKLQHL